METKLPVSLTRFVGREQELNELGRLLRQPRLVMLTGPGGCGKTRLAIEAARGLLEQHADGACFVDLSTLGSEELVASTVAKAAGLAPAATLDLQALVGHLRQRAILIVIDNCEHLVTEAAAVAEAMARGCPRLRLLTTSREPLGVDGERVFRVGALAQPDAVHLFVDRAQEADTAFRLDATNQPSVAAICRRLDAMPLALELAAAYASAMAPAQLLERLDQRFRLLVGGHSKVPRHQTLRATVEWSEALLSRPERRLFRRLGVFVGGFDLEAAEAAAGGPDLPAEEVLALLRRLVERSLVQFDRSDGLGRYRLLETLRDHALERLMEAGEAQKVREAHAAHFMKVALRHDQLWPHLDYALMHRELGNFRSALENTQSAGSALFASLAARLMPFWTEVWLGEGRSWMEAALTTQPADHYIRTRLARGLGILTMMQGDLNAARDYNRMALAICEQSSDKVEAARVLSNWAAVETRAGDSEAARDYAQRAEQLARESGDKPVQRVALANLSRSQVVSGDLEAALVAAKESVEVATEIGEPFGLRQSLNVLVEAHRARGEVETALVTLREALRIDQPVKPADLESLANMVALLSLSGHPQEALRLAGAVQANSQQLGIGSAPDPSLYKALTEASEMVGPRADQSREAGRRMSIQEAIAFALKEPGLDPFPGVRLTRREVEVARLVRAGMTDAQIAKKLFLSVRTAEGHVESLRNKLGVRTRAEVAAWGAVNLPAEETKDQLRAD